MPELRHNIHQYRVHSEKPVRARRSDKTADQQAPEEVLNDEPLFNFAFILAPDVKMDDDTADLIYGAVDDVLCGMENGRCYVEFDRAGESLSAVVLDALGKFEIATGLRVDRVEPDDLVGLSAIAARVGRSVEGVRLMVEGKRGPGAFPAPVSHVDARTRLWSWADVAEWWSRHIEEDVDLAGAAFLPAINDVLDARARKAAMSTVESERFASFATGVLA